MTEFDQEKYENTIRQEAIEEKQIEMIQTMYSNGASIEVLSQLTNLDISYIQSIIQQK